MQQAISVVLKIIDILVKNESLFVSNNVDLVSPKIGIGLVIINWHAK